MSRSRLRCILVPGLLGCLVSTVPSSLAAEPKPTPSGTRRVTPPEIPDDPPGPVLPRGDASARSPGARVIEGVYVSIQVNVDPQGQNIVGDAANEPSLAVNPERPGNMVIGWRQFDTITSNFRQGGWAYTLDNGSTWNFPGVLTPGNFRSDPVLDFDSEGNVYYQSLDGNLNVQVFKSTDGGVTWGPQVDAFGGDKNWIAVDKTLGVGDGHIYGIWQRFFACCGEATLTRSTDAGLSFEFPVTVDLRPTFGTLAVGGDGELYAVGIDGTVGQNLDEFVIARSDDARDAILTPTFVGFPVPIGGSMAVGAGPNPAGLLGQANVVVDASNGPNRGTVYALASVTPFKAPGPLDVHLVRSSDGGANWTPPLRVNDDPIVSGNWHWFGAVSVAPNGRIDVVWNDTRNSGLANMSQLFYAYSYDGGRTFSDNVAVSPPFDSHVGWPAQNKIGDYYQIVSDATGGRVAYSATFNGEQDVYYLRAFPDCNGNTISDEIDIGGASPDCNSNRVPDECESPVNCVAAGSVPSSDGILGSALRLDRSEVPGDIGLTWSGSCLLGDTDYGVYEGTLGDFTSHASISCSSGGQTEAEVSPATGSTYYLVVPQNADREGSYGRDSAGAERSQGLAPCRIQAAVTCPG